MENDETNNEEVVNEEKDEPEEVVRGSLLRALGVISPDEVDKLDAPADPALDAEPAELAEPAEPEPAANDVLPDGIVDSPAEPEPEPDPIKISAKDIRVKRRPRAAAPEPVEPTPEPEIIPEPEPEPAAVDLSHLSKRERDTLELMRFGEESGLSGKGSADDVLKYYEERKAIIKKLQDENIDDDDYDMSQDRELDRWKKRNPPPIDAESLDDIRQERTIKIAEDRAAKRMESSIEETRKELEDYKRSVEAEKKRPTVDSLVSKFSDDLLSGMPEEVTSVVSKEQDWAKVEEALPVEAPIVKRVLNKYADQVEVFLSVVNGVAPQDGSDPIQAEVRQFMFEQADILLAKGNTLRGGKQFVHPARFVSADAHKTWTFSSDQVVQMLQAKARKVAKREISFEQKRIDSIISRRGGGAPALKSAGDEAPRSTSVGSSPAADPVKGSENAGSGLLGALGL